MVCTRNDNKCDDESSQKYECVHDRGHSTAINPDFGTVRLHNDHILVRGGLGRRSVPIRVLVTPLLRPPSSLRCLRYCAERGGSFSASVWV